MKSLPPTVPAADSIHHIRYCCTGILLIAPFVVTVPLLYQISMEHHVFSLSFMHLENQEIRPILTFIKTNSASLTYEIRVSALDT